jgi:hypothetical protein
VTPSPGAADGSTTIVADLVSARPARLWTEQTQLQEVRLHFPACRFEFERLADDAAGRPVESDGADRYAPVAEVLLPGCEARR